MGYERKRGKLSDLNWLLRRELRQEIHPRFALVVGETAILPEVKYVITLDTDTQLARDSARQFVGSMDHPLNRAQYDPQRQRVVAGYGILQPRMGASMGDSSRSLYARMCASEPGIDPYTKAVSDVYQDLFGEGSFIGKGIYEVDTFERVLSGRFPDNRILSHDLIEGCYVRAGLLNDLLLFEEYPASYGSDVIRRHRWIRGDWQIARWMFPRVPSQGTRRISNPLSVLSRWKILDNLRRSLSAAAMTILLLLGWTVFTSAWFWTLAVLGTIFVPILLATVIQLLRKPDDVPPIQHWALSLDAANLHMAQGIFMLSCLPHEMSYSLDAILRTAWRVLFSKKNLLQWNPSGGGVPAGQSQLIPTIQSMWCGPILAITTTLGLLNFKPWSLLAASPLLVLWLVSPVIVWWMSRPHGHTSEDLTPSQNLFLRHLSRKTWAFFETFVGANDHWLPPDNFQEYPEPVVAHRTSPTNMGLALLANLAAYDFGYINAAQFLERSTQTLRTMDGLERYRGHFFNWYDTISLKPLTPLYVSSVDSGNLVGHLLTLRQGLLAFPDAPILSPRVLAGLTDTLSVLESALPLTLAPIQRAELRQLLNTDQPEGLQALRLRLELLLATAQELASLVEAEEPDPTSLGQWWMHAFVNQCRDGLTELTEFAPWASRLWPQWQGEADLDRIPSLRELVALGDNIQIMKQSVPGLLDDQSVQAELWPLLTKAADNASHRMTALGLLARQCEALSKIEYLFLYNENLHLLAIGFNVSEHRLDANYYDLLASEARLATFVGIAQGELPQESWFALGRLVTMDGGNPILLSWSGSMFEYLMPLLVMPGFEHTLLDQTCRATVAKQIEYGRKRNVPWGISECGYNAIDVQQNYQYRAFGVPGLGLKRGLATDLVIAPYASALALMIAPKAACSNLMRLSDEGYEAIFGLYEAGDYTPTRLARGQDKTVIRSFMAHHQGMSLLAMAHLLLHRPMQKRFEANPLFQATLLLLQERIPKTSAFYAHTTELSEQYESSAAETQIRIFATPDTINPEVQLLSNGRYHVMLTNAGGGYSTWKDLAVTRWREDRTCDRWGMFCFLCDVTTRDFWSASYQPVCSPTPKYETIFSEGRVEFRTQTRNWDTHSEITVSPEDDIELRRIRITNRSKFRRSLDVTSYAEVVIAPAAADAHHPAFSNLFVQTEILSEQQAILCSRRPRAQSEQQPWMLHMLAVPKTHLGEISYETDRMQFIGRENSITSPQAMAGRADYFSGALSNSQGAVLDPIVAIRCRITLDPEESLVLNYVLGMGETKEDVLGLLEKYQDHRIAERVFDLAWTHGQVLLRQFNASEADAQLYSKLAGSIIHASAGLRADPGLLIRNFRGQSGLWSYGISGDLPIVLLQIQDTANIELVRQLVQAHAYWRLKGLAVDLVIWNEDQAGYRQILHDLIMGLISAGLEANVTDRPSGIFVRSADRIAEEDRILIQTVARVVISDMRGTLEDQINGRTIAETNIPVLSPTRTHRSEPLPEAALPRHDLAFFNGLGGFTPDGREYVITTTPAQNPPAPWANVLANPLFGTVVSECGSAYTWHENAHEFRLTPWNNDPVTDASGEAFYLRDEERGHFWSPTPLPCRGTTPYVTRHGFGYSVFEHTERGIRSELWVYVALDSAIKFSVLKVTNVSARSRRISATGYVEWVLGDLRPKSAPYVVTEIDPHSGALFARNPYSAEFGTRTAFFDVDDAGRTITGDRTEFIGRNKTLSAPAAMSRTRLSGKTGPALDPCAAIQISMTLESGQEREIIFKLGVGTDADDARAVLHRFRGTTAARTALDKVWQHWTHTLGAINVHTPDQGLNILANGWLLYQTLSCRLWARSAIYQSGGAFGFRDQLQDVMALAHARPFLLREHLLLCASRQFEEGDVQHWWHPPVGRGVRTRCSDDYLWLPCATSRYVSITGDTGILNEVVPFLQGRVLNADEESYYDLPEISTVEASLYEHCVKAIRHGLRTGVHGLPLMGSGDWNDGMNLVGENGTGESVWLAFFLYKVLTDFALLARQYGDSLFAEECVREAARLRLNIETTAWDGNWYRRAYFDDGTALGSIENDECQIDSIAQSWAVLSEAADAERSRLAMDAMDARLVHRKQKLIQLFDPPFDVSSLNPGYIKGYVPGVRENGGQYTHAAIWASMAFAHLGDATRAWELFAMITPINHARNAEEIERYKVEPYAMAADVYANPSHCGRGGWTWYTGSAAWMYRLIMESLLGLHLEVDILHITPCIPAEWTEFIVHYRFKETVYHLAFELKRGTEENIVIIEDGIINQESSIRLVDDHAKHWVTVRISRLG